MGLHLFSHRAAGRGRAWSATGARWARAGGAAGANSARAMRASDVVFHSNAIGLTRSLPAPPGTCAGWRALRCGPGRLTRPKVITPAIAAKPAATFPALQPPAPPLRVLAAFFSGGQFLHFGMFFLPPFGSVSPSPGALNSSASPRLLPLDPPRRPHRELNPRAPAREATSDTTRPRGLGQ